MTGHSRVVTSRCWVAVADNTTTHLWKARNRYRRCLSNRRSELQRDIADTSRAAAALGYAPGETSGENTEVTVDWTPGTKRDSVRGYVPATSLYRHLTGTRVSKKVRTNGRALEPMYLVL